MAKIGDMVGGKVGQSADENRIAALLADIEQIRAERDAATAAMLAAKAASTNPFGRMSIGPKAGMTLNVGSLVTLYDAQWRTLLRMAGQIEAYLDENREHLSLGKGVIPVSPLPNYGTTSTFRGRRS